MKEEINMRLSIQYGFSYGFNLFEANDCHRSTSNHEAHIDNEEKVKKLVSQRTLGESPMRNLKKKQKNIYVWEARGGNSGISEFRGNFCFTFLAQEMK